MDPRRKDETLQWLSRRRGVLLMAAGILAGFWVVLGYAKCVVDAEALSSRFALPEGAGYRELRTFDRGGEELSVLVTCDSCRSHICVVHPTLAAAGTPVFPKPQGQQQ